MWTSVSTMNETFVFPSPAFFLPTRVVSHTCENQVSSSYSTAAQHKKNTHESRLAVKKRLHQTEVLRIRQLIHLLAREDRDWTNPFHLRPDSQPRKKSSKHRNDRQVRPGRRRSYSTEKTLANNRNTLNWSSQNSEAESSHESCNRRLFRLPGLEMMRKIRTFTKSAIG